MKPSASEPRWSDYAAKIAGLLVLGVTLWGQAPDALVGTYVQDGLNVVLAKAIVLGEGFHLIHVPDSPAAHGMAPFYPWLLSLLGRVWPFFPENLLLMQIVSSAMLGAAAWLLVSSLQRVSPISPWLLAVATVVGFANVPVVGLALVPFAEPLVLLCLAGAVRVAMTEPRWWTGVGAGLLAGAAILASVAVAPAAIGVGVAIALCGRFRAAGSALAITIALLALWWYAWGTGPAGSVNVAGLDVPTLGDSLVAARAFFPSLPSVVLALPIAVLIGFAVWGSVAHWKNGSALVLVLVGLALSAWLWPSASPRAWTMTLPWLCGLAGLGVAALWSRLPRARFMVGIAAAVLVATVVPHNVLGVSRQSAKLDETTRPVRYLLSTTVGELPDDAIISTDVAELLYLYTERRTVPWWLDSTRQTARRDFRDECDRGVTHVAVSNLRATNDARFNELTARVWLSSVFELTDGPSLYELQCPD